MYIINRVSVSLFTQVYEMFDLDPASWAALVAQLVRASVRSAECHGFKSHLRQLIFIFSLPQVSVFLSFFLFFFLSFFPSQVLSCTYINGIIYVKRKCLHSKVKGETFIMYELRPEFYYECDWNGARIIVIVQQTKKMICLKNNHNNQRVR